MLKHVMAAAALVAAMAAPAAAHPEVVGYYGNPYYNQGYYAQPAWSVHGNGGNVRPATYSYLRRGGIVLNQAVDLMYAPSVGAPMIACMQPGTTFTLLGRGQGWAKVRSKWGTVGYIPDIQYYY